MRRERGHLAHNLHNTNRRRVQGERHVEVGAVEVSMLRAVNLTVEIFIDEDDGGVWYAEAMMFTTTDRTLLARGRARLEPEDPDIVRMNDGRIAAVALLDLVRTLTDGESPAGDVLARDRDRRDDGQQR